MPSHALLVGAVVGLLTATAAAAAESTYTSVDLATCAASPPHPDDPLESGVWTCDGYGGMPVWISEGDLRFFLSFGDKPKDEPAAAQTMVRFNRIGQKLEWRLDGPPPAGKAYAAIIRYYIDMEDPVDGQVLAVIRLGEPGSICHVAYVDATANPNANELARQAADELAAGFRCGVDETHIIGNRGAL